MHEFNSFTRVKELVIATPREIQRERERERERENESIAWTQESSSYSSRSLVTVTQGNQSAHPYTNKPDSECSSNTQKKN